MGQKINPIGFRLSQQKNFVKWFANFNQYAVLIKLDKKLQDFFIQYSESYFINQIHINYNLKFNNVFFIIETLYPTQIPIIKIYKHFKFYTKNFKFFNILLKTRKIQNPLTKINLLAFIISEQIRERITFQRIIQLIFQQFEQIGINGFKIAISGRLNGIEKAKTEWYKYGRLPLNTLSANIKYTQRTIKTKYGNIGLKIWLFQL